ncbi:amidase [Rhodotorula sp. JG-1b]|nr:amidase [Rhodotorula sp. JG-1b]
MLVAPTLSTTVHKDTADLAGSERVEANDWAIAAAAKRSAQAALIPPAYRLPPAEIECLPRTHDLREYVSNECSLLSDRDKEITNLDEASELLQRLREGVYTAVEVTEAFCRRAAVAQQLTNCLSEIFFDRALTRAHELDEHLKRTGKPVGPLHGLAISLKDQFDIVGIDSTMGFVSQIGRPAEKNGVLVAILLKLGAILYCKTNVPQTLMAAETNNNIFGRTLNPRNRDLTCGGSSGGEGALLALKGSILGVGTDYGGSIRVPSHCCGLYGLRPTTRRIPYAGTSNVMKGYEGMESTIGPMARSLDSLNVFMEAVIGAEPAMYDSKVIERPWCSFSSMQPPQRLHIAFAYDNGFVHAHPPLRRALDELAQALTLAGHDVRPLTGIDWAESKDLVRMISGADGGQDLRSFLPPSGEPIIPESFPFATSAALTVYELSKLMQRRDAFRLDFLRNWRETAAQSDTGRPFDLIICPTTTHLAWPHLGKPQEPELITWTTTWSVLDIPAMTLPVRQLDSGKDAAVPLPGAPFSAQDQQHWNNYHPEVFANAPVTVQLVNPRRFHEDELLCLAATVEAALAATQQL